METRGDILIRGLWEIHTGAIIDVRFGDAVADTYKYEPLGKLLVCWEKENKYKPVKHCHDQCRNFYPFPLSLDDKLRKEALVVL